MGRGHSYAMGRLSAMRDAAGGAQEVMGGVEGYLAMKQLKDRIEQDYDSVVADLEALRSSLFHKGSNMLVNLTADDKTLTSIEKEVQGFVDSLPSRGVVGTEQWYEGKDSSLLLPKRNELLIVPTQVSYVGKATNLYKDGQLERSGSSMVVSKLLSTTWLWDRVRMVGGAYGGFGSFDSQTGLFSFASYRDPNLGSTLTAYDGSAQFLKELKLDKDELTKAIIATVGDVDSYSLPDQRGYTALVRHLLGITDEERQQRRDEILSTTVRDFHEFGEALDQALASNSQVSAVTSKDMAAQASEEMKDLGFTSQQIL